MMSEKELQQQLGQYASSYAAAEDKLNGKGDDQSSIHYPAVFLFIGDKTAEAVAPIVGMNDRKWENGAGVMYVHVGSEGLEKAGVSVPLDAGMDNDDKGYGQSSLKDRVYRYDIPYSDDEERSLTHRQNLHQQLYSSGEVLLGLTKILRQVSSNIADYGRMYSSFDRIHISMITRVDDPLNVLLPELSILAKSVFGQSFKSVQMDLYALISEREQSSYGYQQAIGVAFLRELELMQQSDFVLEKELVVKEDGISIPILHPPSPLFDLVYSLSDRNEKGMSSQGGLHENYEIIAHMSLLKNRKLQDDHHRYSSNIGTYNNTSFKNNLMTESGRAGLVSAGLSKVKRPNHSIALAVLYHFCSQLVERMQQELEISGREKLSIFGLQGLDGAPLITLAQAVLPEAETIAEMTGMMTHPVGYSSLRRMTLREAEEALFGDGGAQFFEHHYTKQIAAGIGKLNLAEQLAQSVEQGILQHSGLSFYQLADWTSETGAGSIRGAIHQRMRELSQAIESARLDLSNRYQERVEEQPFQKVPLLDKHNVRSFVRYLIETVYQAKVEIASLEAEITLLRQYEREVEQLHNDNRVRVQQMESILRQLKEAAHSSIRRADDYIGQNIMEYYGLVTADVMREMEGRRGNAVFFEERVVGNVGRLLEEGEEKFINRLIIVCQEQLLTAEPFKQPFEKELLQRANVTVDYSNKQVLPREELFKKLYHTLEEHAVINIRLLDYTQEHRYEEKYFIGDADSEFIRYCLGAEETSRIYKLGYVHEKRSSGVEKLNMMGGFHVEDLLYYRNGRIYYEKYQQNGYELHGITVDRLPELR